ncbi:unnamed protein product [Notodromas monacha]|uniref:NEDD8 ultimate buster 1 n=1 Tax=Notodromas monacha TaxID=399045 RepID=A0A7R9BD88_9CRUS|nr:unnamed protein product [Notodromas monacha]CAG0912374.1 unnamed protein product [Notodromas monacha]
MSDERHKLSVKRFLLARKIHLWKPPYSVDGVVQDDVVDELSGMVAAEVGLTKADAFRICKELQALAAKNLKEKEEFLQHGIATLQLRLAEDLSSALQVTDKLSVKVRLDEDGKDLVSKIAAVIKIDQHKIKCIVKGRVIKSESSLASQNVAHGDTVLIVVSKRQDLAEQEAVLRSIQQIKTDAHLLADAGNSDDKFLQIRDQTGSPVKIPEHSRLALMTALALYDRGRTELKFGHFSKALIFFLESDSEFKKCSTEFVDLVDNYALLNLDIVWCYLCLGSLTALPDAAIRLETGEKTLKKSYGPNLARASSLKTNTGAEKANMLRLRLMQGILEYHRGNIALSRTLLRKVKEDLTLLKVSDENVSRLVDLGYSAFEARVALRECLNNVSSAVEHIETKRKKKREMMEQREKAKKRRAQERLLGCMPGSEVPLSVEAFDILRSMGYTAQQSRLGLLLGNNSVARALELFAETVPRNEEVRWVSQDLGFMPMEIHHALDENGNDIRTAVNVLLEGFYASAAREISGSSSSSVIPAAREITASRSLTEGSTTTGSDSSSIESVNESEISEETWGARDRLAEIIPGSQEDYLDFSLELEEKFLNDYLHRLTE